MPATIPSPIVNRTTKITNNKNTQATELSKTVHRLKRNNRNFKLNWKIVTSEPKARPGVETCRLCIKEANTNCINIRNEVMNICRHMSKFLLKNWRSAVT